MAVADPMIVRHRMILSSASGRDDRLDGSFKRDWHERNIRAWPSPAEAPI
jgi:hypothetical protein